MAEEKTTEQTPAQDPAPDAMAEARSNVGKLTALEQDLANVVKELRRRLARAEEHTAAAGVHARLAGGDVPSADALAKLRAEIDLNEQAEARCRERRVLAIRETWKLEAAQLREQAADKRPEADELEGRVKLLLGQLRELANVDYIPDPREKIKNLGEPGVNKLLQLQVRAVDLPRHVALRNEANDLDKRAAALETKPVPDGGQVWGASPEELVSAVLSDPFRLGPRLADIRAWAEAAVEACKARRRKVRCTTVEKSAGRSRIAGAGNTWPSSGRAWAARPPPMASESAPPPSTATRRRLRAAHGMNRGRPVTRTIRTVAHPWDTALVTTEAPRCPAPLA